VAHDRCPAAAGLVLAVGWAAPGHDLPERAS
jgi:hypothetical protein